MGDVNNSSTNVDDTNSVANDSANSADDSSGNSGNQEIDVQAFADIISEKDKQLSNLQEEITKLKKSNAEMLVRINAGTREEPKDLGLTIMEFCDTRKIKKAVDR